MSRFAGDEAFHEAEFEPLDPFDVEANYADLVERSAEEVLAAEWHGEDFE